MLTAVKTRQWSVRLHVDEQWLRHLQSAKISWPVYPVCTVCTCTWGLTTLEAPPEGKRESHWAKVCDWGKLKWLKCT